MPKIIGLCGYKGSGKTTVTEVAINIDSRGAAFTRIGFADPFGPMLIAMGLPSAIVSDKSQWNDPQDILAGKSVRHAAQTLGTEWGRKCLGENVWTALAIVRAERLMTVTGGNVIIDNVRFHNEASAIVAAGGDMIAMHRDNWIIDTSHESEQHVADIQDVLCDYEFTNTGADLEDNARRFLELLINVTSED